MVRTERSLEDVEEALLGEYYEGRVSLDVVAVVLGEVVAINVFLLKRSLDDELPAPQLDVDELPTVEEFYGDLPAEIEEIN